MGSIDPANILYGMEVSQEHLDQVLEFLRVGDRDS